MADKIRILTYHYIPNNGAFLFAYALIKLFEDTFVYADTRVLHYKSSRLFLYEYLKRFKPLPGMPLFYYKRARLWDQLISRDLKLDTSLPKFAGQERLLEYFSRNYDALVVGMDVWCVLGGSERPTFPNIYWLPEQMAIPKIAYGVSAYNSDTALIEQHAAQIGAYLDDFEVIAARDRFTYEIITKHRQRSDGLVALLPDPTFYCDFDDPGVDNHLQALGVDLTRPLVGLLLYGDDGLSSQICDHYRAQGCQVLALSMYNRFADINLGHLLTPFEWAAVFRRLSFCFSDRFHGTVFSIKSGIPFISLEKDRHLPLAQSKIYDLLEKFDLTTCYINPSDEDFQVSSMLAHAAELAETWDVSFRPRIEPLLITLKQRHSQFGERIRECLSGYKERLDG